VSFTTRAKVKARLRIPSSDTTHDDLIDDLVTEVNAGMLGLFQLDQCDVKSYTRTYDIREPGVEAFWLTPYPVVALTSISVNGVSKSTSDFYFRNPDRFGMLSYKTAGTYFLMGNAIVEVTHTAGWASVPDELSRAATILAVHGFNTDDKIGFDSEQIGQYRYKLAAPGAAEGGAVSPGGWPGSVARALALHLRPFAVDE
jgi:hypothetical protein